MKKTVLKGFACGAASYFGYHQPKEPKNIKAVLKK